MVMFLRRLQTNFKKNLMSDHSVKDAEILEFVVQHNKIIVWTADLNLNLLTFKGSLSSSHADTQSIERELRSLLQNEAEQISKVGKDKPILIKHQLSDMPVETNIKLSFNSDNLKTGIIGITNLCMAQLAIDEIQERQARALGDFLEAASHDLRTPLSVINTNLFLIENSKDEGKRTEHLQLLKETLHRLQLILDNMFLMARIDALPSFVSNPIQLDVMLHNIVVDCDYLASAKNIDLKFQQFDILPTINGHETQLQTAISNIVENAIQNTESGGWVKIDTTLSNNSVVIKIVDNGKGISEEDLPYVFERFYRVDKYRPSEETRIGLGLSIANTVIEKHNGQITIDSELGKGTTVVITLPT